MILFLLNLHSNVIVHLDATAEDVVDDVVDSAAERGFILDKVLKAQLQ